jgi:hypothetical protein
MAKLNAAKDLIPHRESRSGGRIPRSIAIGKSPAGIAEFELHNRAAASRPFRPLQGIGGGLIREKGETGNSRN